METIAEYAIFRIIQFVNYYNLIKPTFLKRVLLVALLFLPFTNFSYADETHPQSSDSQDILSTFYKDPRPERLVGFLDALPGSLQWKAYPPIAGFYAVVFQTNPKWIGRLFPTHFNPKTAATMTAALHLGGDLPISAELNAKLISAGTDPTLKGVFANLPNHLENLHITSATHLDILWGAAFASGNPRFVEMIIEFFAQTANRSEEIALDTSRVVIAMAGGSDDILKTLKSKYGAPLATRIIIAASALWSLESNAKQHLFVKQTLEKYVKTHAGTPATKAIQAIVFRETT